MASAQDTIGRISLKRYRCDECGEVFKIETNHWGEIYRGCRWHGYGFTSQCVEAEMFLLDLTSQGDGNGEIV